MAPPSSPSAQRTQFQRLVTGAVRLFHDYANWLVGISWRRFLVLSLLLVIAATVLEHLPPFSWTFDEIIENEAPEAPRAPKSPSPPRAPRAPAAAQPPATGTDSGTSISIDKNGVRIVDKDGVHIIDKDGVRITPSRSADAAASAASAAASAASAAEAAEAAASDARPGGGIEIRLPPGATSDEVRQAVEDARASVEEAIEDARQAREDAREAAREAADAAREERAAARSVRRRTVRPGDFLTDFAWLFIAASAILKITYKGRIQAEVKAAAATETAESEQLKRQVVEARMAAMQAQVEPHFLFNTLASIDHLIETDPPRASQMQKNLIALLRASMPTIRESHPTAHNLGREMAVIRPYLEILKVRMEDRLQTDIQVPDGLLSAEFPSMMIQSLVENAIKHGLEPKAEGGRLTVRAEIVHGKLAVTVADTGLGFGKAATAGTGTGLNNIRERLQLLHGNKASMTVSENAPSGTVVTLTVPYLAQTPEGFAA